MKAPLPQFTTSSSAETYARKMNAPNTVAYHSPVGDGSFHPVLLLRPDQSYMAERIRERGIIPVLLSHENWAIMAEALGVLK